MASSKRLVRAVVTSYKHEDGTVRVGLRGEEVEVASGDLERFDAAEAEVPATSAPNAAEQVAEPPKQQRSVKK